MRPKSKLGGREENLIGLSGDYYQTFSCKKKAKKKSKINIG